MLIDTHAHINFNAYRDDADEVIRRSLKNDIWVINVGAQYSTSKRAVDLAKKYKQGVYAAVALHPIHVGPSKFIDDQEVKFKTRPEEFNRDKYKQLALDPKVVAVGETGLDYYRVEDKKIREKQKQVLKQHLDLAEEVNKPLIFHCRKAYEELFDILNFRYKKNFKIKGVLHCYMGKKTMVEKFLNLGLYLGFDGPITYCHDFDSAILKTPLDRILIETDSPYLTPAPHREKRNEPLYVKYIAQRIAEIKRISFKQVAEQTTKNARKLFGI